MVFAGHYPNAINPIDASKAGQKSFEHAHLFFTHANPYADQLREYYRRYYSDDETASEIEPSNKEMFESFDLDMFYELVDVMIENETYYCPTHVTRRYEANSGNEAFTSDPNVKYIPPIALMIWKEDKAGIVEYMAKEDNEEHLEAYYLKGLELTGLAHERGLKIIAGTDCYDPYSFPGITLHTELKEMVKGGLTPAEALQTATVHAAEYFDVLDDYGTVEVNKIAKLLILDKNPLENIENTRSIQYLFFNGDKYDKEDLNQIKNYVEDNASGLKGLSISVKMLARMASDNRHQVSISKLNQMQISFRVIQADEYEFLNEMLYEALFVLPGQPKFPKEIIEEPSIKKYIENWNQKEGDLAIVCLDGEDLIGAIWGRKFSEDNKGYGFIDVETPEIGMAIKQEYRGKGLGSNLIKLLVDEYLEQGVGQLSLNVNTLNPAKRLYERCGFVGE